MGKLLKKVTNSLFYSYLCYFLAGGAYNVISPMDSIFQGQYNTDKIKARKSVKNEVKRLEDLLTTAPNNKRPKIHLELYIDTEIKRFYDDYYNNTDNNDWVNKVLKALQGLNIYKEQGLNFVIDKVSATNLDYGFGINLGKNIYYIDRIIRNKFYAYPDTWHALTKERFKIFILPPVNNFTFGYAKPVEGYAVIFMTHSSTWNESTVAHEVGHLLGLKHAKLRLGFELSFLIDPFNLFIPRDVMLQGILKNKYKLSGDELGIINAVKDGLIHHKKPLIIKFK